MICPSLPKIGPLKPLSFKAPSSRAEALFAESVRQASARYRAALADLSDGTLALRNTDFDTGQPASHGEYTLADDTYAQLLDTFHQRKTASVSLDLRKNIQAFYGSPAPASRTKNERKRWKHVRQELAELAR